VPADVTAHWIGGPEQPDAGVTGGSAASGPGDGRSSPGEPPDRDAKRGGGTPPAPPV
jgi:hypothetical protein